MLKQKKNLKFKKFKSKHNYKNKSKKTKLNRTFSYFKKVFKTSRLPLDTEALKLLKVSTVNSIKFHLVIRLTPNNVFCSFINLKKNKTLFISSAGIYKLNVSKKTLNFNNKIIIQNFLDEVKKILFLTKKFLLVTIYGPLNIRTSILTQLSKNLKGIKLIIKVKEMKVFNGCRPSKQRRKKQTGLKIFK